MKNRRFRLTPELLAELCQRLKAGAFDHVACESLGIPHEVFQQWISRGAQSKASKLYRDFVQQVREAKAHARLMAEVQMRTDNPRLWLLHGPGKETPERAGWSAPPKAFAAGANTDQLSPEMVDLISEFYKASKPYPELRQKLAATTDKKSLAQKLP